ncbi:8990_t:CDS:2 [Acaulospora morrowiae]|uniref:8990_t:CDS:1 n=1 Tax=Acaulospora morrowiae TaxID=94023 RepID=A0A9N9DL54_9GLOM|nr:8990_t:CDS:2 [Acaulospora morrowiae]
MNRDMHEHITLHVHSIFQLTLGRKREHNVEQNNNKQKGKQRITNAKTPKTTITTANNITTITTNPSPQINNNIVGKSELIINEAFVSNTEGRIIFLSKKNSGNNFATDKNNLEIYSDSNVPHVTNADQVVSEFSAENNEPMISIGKKYDPKARRKSLTFTQSCKNTPAYFKNRTRLAMHKILAQIFGSKDDENPVKNGKIGNNLVAQDDAFGKTQEATTNANKKRTKTKLSSFISSDEPPYPWSLEKYYKVSKKVLGRGSFAVVKECTDKRTGVNYALKIILKTDIRGKEQMLTTELDVLKQVDHPNVVSLHDLFETKEAVYIITGLALGGELFGQLLQRGSYTEKDAAALIEQILQGVEYLHAHEIVHRDLKPENLLFSDKSSSSKLMITDFGLSKILTHHNDILMTACGTPGYVAPEVLKQIGYGKPVDIWSVGVILYTMLCGYTPFWGEDQSELFESILRGVYHYDDDYWANISDEAKDLIDKMLAYDPDRRITAHDALAHPWFKYAAEMVDVDSSASTPISPQFPLSSLRAHANFKKAFHVIQGVTRLRKLSSSERLSTATVSMNDGRTSLAIYQGSSLDVYTAGVIDITDENHGEGASNSSSGDKSRNRRNFNAQTLGSSGVLGFKSALGTLDEDAVIDNHIYTDNRAIFDYSGNNNYSISVNDRSLTVTSSVWSSSSESSMSVDSEISSSASTIRAPPTASSSPRSIPPINTSIARPHHLTSHQVSPLDSPTTNLVHPV